MKRCLLACMYLFVGLGVFAQDQEKQLFLEAEGRFASGNYELALDRYDALLQEFPLSSHVPDVQFRRAVCMYQVGRIADALALFKTVETRYSYTRFLPYVPFWIGLADYQLKDYAGSVDSFNVYLSGSDTTLTNQALLYKAIGSRALGRTEDARAAFARLVGSLADPASIPYALAELCAIDLRDRQYQQVLDLLDKVALDKTQPEWRERLTLYKAEAYYGVNDFGSAEPLYNLLLNAPPDLSSVAFQRLFAIYQATKQDQKLAGIVSTAEITLAGLPEILHAFWLQVGIDSYKQGRLDLAESYLQRVWGTRTQSGVSPYVPLYLSEIMAKSGRIAQAVNVLSDALKAPAAPQPDYRDSMLFRLGSFQLQLGQWAQSHGTFDTFLQVYPESASYSEAAYLDAFTAYKAGDFSGALSSIDRVFASAKTGGYSAKLLKLKSVVYKSLGDSGRAIQALEEYIPLAPEDVASRVELAKLYFEQKNYVTVLNLAGKLATDFPDLKERDLASYLVLQYLKGLILISQKDYAPALAALSELSAAALKKSDLALIEPYTLFYRGWAAYRLADYAGARASFDQLVASYPDSSLSPSSPFTSPVGPRTSPATTPRPSSSS